MKNLLKQFIDTLYKKRNNGLKILVVEQKLYFKILFTVFGNNFVHCFIEKQTGNVYKPKSYVSPNIKDSKYNLFINFGNLLNDCEVSGRYLTLD